MMALLMVGSTADYSVWKRVVQKVVKMASLMVEQMVVYLDYCMVALMAA